MIDTIYVEDELKENANAEDIIRRINPKNLILCESYKEVFNKKSQNFKLQKKKPSLILAKKKNNFLLEVPKKYTIGGEKNFYFSHMLNCIYDCRYCFLQGMFDSANYVIFINYKDFLNEIKKKVNQLKGSSIHFFSGYDCDSLALEPVSHFMKYLINKLDQNSDILLELRTKSTQINFLTNQKVIKNILIAFTLSPNEIIENYEFKTASLKKRIRAIKLLQDIGWKIGLRFDPIIYSVNYKEIYEDFFNSVFNSIDQEKIHSVTIGTLRMPNNFFKKLIKNYPNEHNLFSETKQQKKLTTYDNGLNEDIINFCKKKIISYIDNEKLYINN